MTRIDFYQIETDEPANLFTCRLIEKAWHQGNRVYVHTAGAEESRSLDDLLWTFRADSFIPHDQLAANPTGPVHIGHADEPGDHDGVLINLGGGVPDFFSRFERVAEIVPLSDESRQIARQNYTFYQHRGYPLDYHAITQGKTRGDSA
jgi:DNA polymerase-3 subunit chi|tara:strand:+ start:103 stop:546 length:444 start_codon:yes stop_codon:yes gene_type:complete